MDPERNETVTAETPAPEVGEPEPTPNEPSKDATPPTEPVATEGLQNNQERSPEKPTPEEPKESPQPEQSPAPQEPHPEEAQTPSGPEIAIHQSKTASEVQPIQPSLPKSTPEIGPEQPSKAPEPVPVKSNPDLNGQPPTEPAPKPSKKNNKTEAAAPAKDMVTIAKSELTQWLETSASLKKQLKAKEDQLKTREEQLKVREEEIRQLKAAQEKERSGDAERLRRSFESEKEALLDRNKTIQALHDNFKDRYEKARRQIADLDFRFVALNKDAAKVEEEMRFYKEQLKEKFNLQVKVNEMSQEIADLKQFKEEALKSDAQVRNKELTSQNAKLAKQNELLNQTIDKLEENKKKLVNLAEKRTKETETAQREAGRLREENKDLKQKVEDLKTHLLAEEENRSKEAELRTTMADKHAAESNALKVEIRRSLRTIEAMRGENEALKNELGQIIENVRRTHVSGVDSAGQTGSAGRKEEKMILESMVLKNKELEAGLRFNEKEVRRLKLSVETLEEKMAQKEAQLLELASLSTPQSNLKGADGSLADADLKRIQNAKQNKSLEEMKELVERVLVENAKLKRLSQSQKVIVPN